jgi:hypothetical protein
MVASPLPVPTGPQAARSESDPRRRWGEPLARSVFGVLERRGRRCAGEEIWSTSAANATGAGTCSGQKATVAGNTYCEWIGTSFAAPYVSALAGYLLAANPTSMRVKFADRITDWADAHDVIQAFDTVLSLPGAAKELVDVNDDSVDGNHRVNRGPGNTELGLDLQLGVGSDHAAPDGVIDMGDFRRYRDAWLTVCWDGPIVADPQCPVNPAANILLDGGDNHPKKDLNWDGCVYISSSSDPKPVRHCRDLFPALRLQR